MKGFAWQDGYAAFSVSKSNLADVVAYVEAQREHHRGKDVSGGVPRVFEAPRRYV
jgi:hypothetical protein